MSEVGATTVRIPQGDPKANYLAHAAEIDRAIAETLLHGQYILGPQVAAFEEKFGNYLGNASVVAVASGTDALQIALRAGGIGPGDRVLTVSHTAVATVAAIQLSGAIPVLTDVSPDNFTLDSKRLEEELRKADPRLKALVAVHLYGHPADMPSLLRTCRKYGLLVVEDCAQALGAAIEGRRVGTWGDIAAFSFYPTKNLGALGDGGAVATRNPEYAVRARLIREYGWRTRYVSDVAGMNSRLDEIQAAILRVKLKYLDAENQRRRQIAVRYDKLLIGAGIIPPSATGEVYHVYHQYVIQSPRRDELREALRQEGVETAVHYPVPVHRQPAYQGQVAILGSLDVTERIAPLILSLPIFPELSDEQVDRVASLITRWKPGRKRIVSAGVQTSPNRIVVFDNLQPGHDGAGDCR